MKVWLLMQPVEKLTTSSTASSGELSVMPGSSARPVRSCRFRACSVVRSLVRSALGALRGRQAQAHDIGRVLGAGAQTALLMAADVGRVAASGAGCPA